MRNIYKDLSMHIIRSVGNQIYYFDENGVLQKTPIKEATKINFKNCHKNIVTSSYLCNYIIWHFVMYDYFNCNNQTLLKKILATLKVGDTVEVLDEYLSTIKLNPHTKMDEKSIERFITKINNPDFRRTPENSNENTFDFIFVDVNILTDWYEDRVKYIKKHFDKITEKVLTKLESNKRFQKFGVPINFLKVSDVYITHTSILRFVFELKMK